jgi:hypothetical protein
MVNINTLLGATVSMQCLLSVTETTITKHFLIFYCPGIATMLLLTCTQLIWLHITTNLWILLICPKNSTLNYSCISFLSKEQPSVTSDMLYEIWILTNKQTPWPLVYERTIPSDRHLSTKLVPTFVDRGVSHGQRHASPTVVNLSFLDRSRYFSFK